MKKLITSLGLIVCMCLSTFTASATAAVTNSNIEAFSTNSLVKTDGSFWIWGADQPVPTQVHGLTDVKQSFPDRLIMKKDNTVWYWQRVSSSSKAELQPVEELNLVAVYSYWNESLAVDVDGKVHRLPKLSGKLDPKNIAPLSGIEDVAAISSYYENSPQNGELRWVFLKKDGTVWRDRNSLESFELIEHLNNISKIKGNLALKADGTVWSWPKEFAREDIRVAQVSASKINGIDNIKKIESNDRTHIAIDGESHLWFWGSTITGYSDSIFVHEHAVPFQLAGIKNVKDAFLVEQSLIALTQEGNVYETSVHREAMPAKPSFRLIASDVVEIKADMRHLIMQKTNGTLWGWGVNKNAQLGSGDYEFMHTTAVQMQQPISIELNGESVVLSSGVIVRNNQAFIPLRSIFEKLGAKVSWDNMKKIVTIEQSESDKPAITVTVDFKLEQTNVNNQSVDLPTKPFAVGNTSYLPLRFISESLGAKVNWLQSEDKIQITMN